jgi:hypothetical protein
MWIRGAAAWSSGLALVSFVLEDRGLNPGAGTRVERNKLPSFSNLEKEGDLFLFRATPKGECL